MDEHVWTSPYNAMVIIEKITDALCHIDPHHAGLYQKNAGAYLEKLNELDKDFRNIVETGKRRTVVFGDRFPFRHFTEHYGLTYYAAFPGCMAETEASAADVAFLIDRVRSEGIPVIFYGEMSAGGIARAISDETGAAVRLMHSGHTLSVDDFNNGISYLDLMKQNALYLREALHD
jgi:zinc transport system substrate-binding protein